MSRISSNITIKRIAWAESAGEVLDALFLACNDIGGDKFSYHPEVMFEGMTSARSDVYWRGFPHAWTNLYLNGGARLADPIPDVVMRLGRAMTWAEAVEHLSVGPEELSYFEAAKKAGLHSGLGFPLWGPKGQNAFAAIGFRDPGTILAPARIRAHHTLLLAGHQRIVELVPGSTTDIVLSSREVEILQWIGRGKSNTDAATILGISPGTVASYIRRVFAKLDCNDRTGAVIKALKLGLIRL